MFSLDGYWTLRTRAARVRRSDRGIVAITGRDRATWLQGLVTNDVLALKEGESCYSAYLTPQGRMITDMHVIALDDRLWLDVPAPLAASLRDRLDGLIFAEDAQVVDESSSIAVWGVYGPEGTVALGTVPFSTRSPGIGNSRFSISDPGFGVPGFTLYLEDGQALPDAVAGLPEVNLETLDVLRIEAGTPKFLVDMTEDTIPLEAGIEDRAISFTKGCYVGQEVIVRVTHRGGGRVARRLVGWKDSTHAIAAGTKIASGDREIGRVTSAAFSPAEQSTIGFGYVHRDFIHPDTPLAIGDGDQRIGARVTRLL